MAEIKAATDVTRLDYEAKRAEILKAVRAELDALDLGYPLPAIGAGVK